MLLSEPPVALGINPKIVFETEDDRLSENIEHFYDAILVKEDY